MNISFVDLKKQYIDIKDEIDSAIAEVIANTAFINGPYVTNFEKSFSEYCGVKHCIGVGNGTDAIFIALKALGIGRGDEVITAANSFIATSEAISMTGAKVVFVDVNPETYNIDVGRIREKITSKTKVIVPVHLYGYPSDTDPIITLAEEYDLKIIEDAAQAHGAYYKGKPVGSIGDAACFSFYPGKNLGAYGDAGAIVTNSEELATKCRMFANHGRISKYDHEFEGINSRMDGIQGAILNTKLKHLPQWIEKRRHVASLYNTLFKEQTEITTPKEDESVRHVYHLYVIRVHERNNLQSYLKKSGIPTGIHYPIALPNLQAYKYLGHKAKDFPISSKYQNEILSLPIFPELAKDQISFICDCIKGFF